MTLGATVEGDGVRFAVFSGVADAVELCLFDEAGAETRQPLEPGDSEVWHAHVAGAGNGLRYGYRVRGPGRCDPAKLLLDPYARAIAGGVTWDPAVRAPGVDSAEYVPRSVVHDAPFDWSDDRRLQTPLADSVVYELHVKGFT
ncbi:MAG TPA: glycogen debranching enzyme, partial [Asanoa sp.]